MKGIPGIIPRHQRNVSSKEGFCERDCRRNVANPVRVAPESLDIFLGVKRAIGYVIGPILRIEILFYVLDRFKEDFLVGRIPGIWLGEKWYAVLVRYHAQNELFEIVPMIFAVTIGDLNGTRILFLPAIVITIDAETRGICME